MLRQPLVIRPEESWRQRAAGLVLLLIQLAIAVSGTLEPRTAEWRRTGHVEEAGVVDAGAHNDESCILCAVRSMHYTAPAEPSPSTSLGAPGGPASLALDASRPSAWRPANFSRAPPDFAA